MQSRAGRLRVISGAVLATALIAGALVPGAHAEPPGGQALWVSECAGKHKVVTAPLGRPTPLDVCGTAQPDVFATLTAGADGATMRISKSPSAPASMPLRLEAVMDDPRLPGAEQAAFGFDATGSDAPKSFTGALALTGVDARTTMTLDVTTSGAAPALDVISEVFVPGTSGARTAPKRMRMGYAPVPVTAGISVRPGDLAATLTTGTPAAGTLSTEDLSGVTPRRMATSVDSLPGSLALSVANTVLYNASAAIGRLTLTASDPGGVLGRATDLAVRLDTVPTQVAMTIGDAVEITTASGGLGGIEARASAGPPTATLPAGTDGVVLIDTAETYQMLAQVSGLRSLSVRQRPTIDLALDATAGQGFRVDLTQQAQTLLAEIDVLSPHTHVVFAQDAAGARTLSYAADGGTGRLDLAAGGLPFAGRAKTARLTLTGVPAALTLGLGGESAGRVTLDAGAGLGSLSALLTSGPNGSLTGSGVELIDTASQYTLTARVDGLRRLDVSQRPAIDLSLDAAAQPFTVSLQERQPAGADQTTRVDIGDLPGGPLQLRLSETGGVRKIDYVAAAAVGRIILDANRPPLSGRTQRLRAELRNLPTALTLGLGGESGDIDLDAAGASIGFLDLLLTSGPIPPLVPPGSDGVRLTDVPSHYALHARITGLRRVSASQTDMHLDTTSGNRFDLRIDRQAATSTKHVFTHAVISNLQRNTRLTLDDSGGKTALTYTAAAPTARLDLATNTGDRAALNAAVTPLPASFTTCTAIGGNVCGRPDKPADKYSMRVNASQTTTLNLRDCATTDCAEQIAITDLRVRKLETNVQLDTYCPSGCFPEGSAGRIWLDTDAVELVGSVVVDTDSMNLAARFPPGFDANDRFVDYAGPFTDSSGTIDCVGVPDDGQDLDYTISLAAGFTVDIAFQLC